MTLRLSLALFFTTLVGPAVAAAQEPRPGTDASLLCLERLEATELERVALALSPESTTILVERQTNCLVLVNARPSAALTQVVRQLEERAAELGIRPTRRR